MALFRNSHFSFSVNTEIHDDFFCAVSLREKEAVKGPVHEHTGPGWGGDGLKNYHMTEKIICQYILEILFPIGPVIQVIRAHYLCKMMWERAIKFCILSIKSGQVVVGYNLSV